MSDAMKRLFLEQIQDLYHAEQQLVSAIPRMADASTSTELKNALGQHLNQTRTHITRLEKVFELNGERPQARKCRAMQGLVAETDEILNEDFEPEVMDAAIISCVQKIEHYEISGYGTARTYANMLGQEDAAKLLQTTLDEESAEDHGLTKLAVENINRQAVQV